MKRMYRMVSVVLLAMVLCIPVGCNYDKNGGTNESIQNGNNTGSSNNGSITGNSTGRYTGLNHDRGSGNGMSTNGMRGNGTLIGQNTGHHGMNAGRGVADMRNGNGNGNGNTRGMGMRQADEGQGLNNRDAVIPMTDRNGKLYVPIHELAGILQFKTEWDPQSSTLRVGDNDVAYEIKTNTKEAMREGKRIKLDSPSVLMNGETYIPYEAVEKIFGEAVNFEKSGNQLRIKPHDDDPNNADGVPDFKDDPNDPFGDNNKGRRSAGKVSLGEDWPVATAAADSVALKNIDIDGLIRYGKRFIGVPYDFGAKPFQTRTFDCSTFTQYVYSKYGIKLPRLSRSQGNVGQAVSRSNLRKGDLLFFYLPGRYKSNKIIGHVGIYIGGGQMLHSSNQPKNGVQITSINKSFWKKTYLRARRVAY